MAGLWNQPYYGNPDSPLPVFTASVRCYQGMPGQVLGDCPSQSPSPLAVNYPDLIKAVQKGIIEVFIQFGQGFIYSEPTEVQLTWGCVVMIIVFRYHS